MNIRVILILLAISVLLAYTPRWRKVGLCTSAVLVLLLVWFTVKQPVVENQNTRAPTSSASSAAQVSRLAPTVNLRLDGSGAPWRLSGTIINQSDMPIRSITLQVDRLDCPAAISAEIDCTSVWRGRHTLRMRIAANATVKINESFYSHEPTPRLTGMARDHIGVIDLQ
jgi:hypothetical protein